MSLVEIRGSITDNLVIFVFKSYQKSVSVNYWYINGYPGFWMHTEKMVISFGFQRYVICWNPMAYQWGYLSGVFCMSSVLASLEQQY